MRNKDAQLFFHLSLYNWTLEATPNNNRTKKSGALEDFSFASNEPLVALKLSSSPKPAGPLRTLLTLFVDFDREMASSIRTESRL